MLVIDINNVCGNSEIPSRDDFYRWVDAALKASDVDLHQEISVRIVDESESHALNRQYRNKDNPTNVLSFTCELPEEVDVPLLGDLVICASVVEREAQEQNKSLQSHWAHMVVHGTLHLIGHDHVDNDQAEIMESLETDILTGLGYSAPYE